MAANNLDDRAASRVLEGGRDFRRQPAARQESGEFQIWREAVGVLTTHGGSDPRLERLAAALRDIRAKSAPAQCGVSITDDYLAAFLAGFASAEAHFGASDRGSPSFTINLRADDGPLLQVFHERFALGHLADIRASGRSRPAMSWRVGRLAELRCLTDLFDQYPPRGRAARVYAAWRDSFDLNLELARCAMASRPRYAVVARSNPTWRRSRSRHVWSKDRHGAWMRCAPGQQASKVRAAQATTTTGGGTRARRTNSQHRRRRVRLLARGPDRRRHQL